MSILKIYHYPEKVLRQKAAPITEFTNEIAILADDMAETMWDAPGVGQQTVLPLSCSMK